MYTTTMTDVVAPTGRPFVHLNFAVFADGKVAGAGGQAVAISCAQDWRRVHTLREQYSAVGVGAQTWLRDKPRLTVRREHLGREPRRQPARVIFAGTRPCQVQNDGRQTFLVGRQVAAGPHQVVIESDDHDLTQPLAHLRQRYHLESLLIEGGPTLLRSFVAQSQVDHITIFVRTPSLDEAHEAANKVIQELPPDMTHEAFGDGVLMSGRLS